MVHVYIACEVIGDLFLEVITVAEEVGDFTELDTTVWVTRDGIRYEADTSRMCEHMREAIVRLAQVNIAKMMERAA